MRFPEPPAADALVESSSVVLSPGANPYLTFHCANQGTILIDLAPDDKEYQSVEEEVFVVNMLEMVLKAAAIC